HASAGIAATHCARELFVPSVNHSVKIERAIVKIPVAGGNNLDAAIGDARVDVRHDVSQRTLGVYLRHGRGNHPEAELVAVQSGFAVGDQRVEQLGFRLVEEATVGAPCNVCDDVHSSLSQFG